MTARLPPFSTLAEYGEAIGFRVPDRKGGLIDDDLALEALRTYNERHPAHVTSDIGNGTKYEWELGKAGEEFAAWDFGFSEELPVRVELLDSAGAPRRPQEWLPDRDSFYFDRREVGGVLKLYLVFLTPPGAQAKTRVHWARRHVVSHSKNEVPLHHQMAVVYAGCAHKCEGLAQIYRSGTDGAHLLDTDEKADAYERDAKRWWKMYERTLGIGKRGRIVSRQVRTGTLRVFQGPYA